MIKVGIIGATGYVGAELLRLLSNHKEVKVIALSSVSFEGQEISSVYKNFINKINLKCETMDDVLEKSEVIFTALPHGLSEDNSDISKWNVSNVKEMEDIFDECPLEKNPPKWYRK